MTIWTNKIDKLYDIRVERGLTPYEGTLIVSLHGKELHREPVSISFGARFGADAQDAEQWVDRAVAFIDRQPAA